MRLFDEYMLVGGMPQSVDSFVAENDFRGSDRVKRQIIALYRRTLPSLEVRTLDVRGRFMTTFRVNYLRQINGLNLTAWRKGPVLRHMSRR